MSDMHVVAQSLYSCGSVCACHVATLSSYVPWYTVHGSDQGAEN